MGQGPKGQRAKGPKAAFLGLMVFIPIILDVIYDRRIL
jgi:hypothetical protein